MPIYEFECAARGHIFDRLQKMDDPDPATCDVCGEGPVRRRVTAPAFRLAGSGWYETDFKGDKDKRRNLAGDSDSGSSSSSDSKSAAADSKKSESGSKTEGGSSDSKKSASDSKPAASSSD